MSSKPSSPDSANGLESGLSIHQFVNRSRPDPKSFDRGSCVEILFLPVVLVLLIESDAPTRLVKIQPTCVVALVGVPS